MYVIIETCRDNDCGVSAHVDVIGPFATVEEAKARADELNARDHWATRYSAVLLSKWHWSDPQPKTED